MIHQNSRTARVMGPEALEILAQKHVAIFGVGGVGGYVAEALARSGVGTIEIIDNDDIALTNLNRQIIATRSTVGQVKVTAMANRIRDINPDIQVIAHQTFYMPEQAENFDFSAFDYVIDAIDTVTAKLDIIRRCDDLGTPVISAMGCGNRFDPTKLVVTDIYKTQMDPLAKVIRRELRKDGIRKLKVVYSTEAPIPPYEDEEETTRRSLPGSTPFVPAAAGLIIASEVVRELTGFDPSDRLRGGRQK